MTPPRMRSLATLPELLLAAHRRAVARGRGESLALYLVRLTDVAGLALAVAVHEATGGPDPTVLRERAERAGVSKPVMAAAVAVEPRSKVSRSWSKPIGRSWPGLCWKSSSAERCRC